MKLKKYLAKVLTLGIIISNLPLYSFANSIENQYYNELSNIETKEDLQKSAQRVVRTGEVDTWLEGFANMPTNRSHLESNVVDGKIYCIGGWNGSHVNTVEVYDPITDSWETKTSMPTNRSSFASAVVDGKIYVIGGFYGGYYNKVEVYDPVTDSWETKTSMPTSRSGLSSNAIDNKIYCIGGYSGGYALNKVEVYDPVNDSWETKTSMPTSIGYFATSVIDCKIYVIGGMNSSTYYNTVEVYIAKEIYIEEQATSSVLNAESTKDLVDIETTRELVNQLPEGDLKTQLQSRLDAIIPNISLTLLNGTSSIDAYIKTENILSMTVDTNSITFEDFSGMEDMGMLNALNVTVSSSLPYQLNAYLPAEIQNADKSNTMNKSILNIKENSEIEYKTFTNINEKVVLKDNCVAGNDINHGIDIKLKSGIAHEKDVYKTTIKFEIEQK